MTILASSLLLTANVSLARGVDTSGGSNTFVEAVKTLPPLGLVFASMEKSLIAQGYAVDNNATTIERNPTGRKGLDSFEIKEILVRKDCANCLPVVLHVTGLQQNVPPTGNEPDIFQVESVTVGH